ncbi:MAG: prepilin peptidase [Thermodesulfobacteria bacterium]|nr:prepilin peptidase [Thermodesulfobacteriota bacterium]
MTTPHPLHLVLGFVLGALVGSFLNVCAYRLPRGESIVSPRSRCPSCKTPIRWYDNIPILSYLLLRGRCRFCRAPIPKRYPAVELITALLSLSLVARFGFSIPYFFLFAFTAALLVVSLIDLEFQIIPDEISLPGIVLGLLFSPWNPLTTPLEALLGALCGAGGLYLVAEFYYFFTKREGLGGGDLKLLSMIGAFLGVRSLVPVVFISSLVGALTGVLLALLFRVQEKRTFAIPFGPFLSLGALIHLFAPQLVSRLLPFWPL